MPANTLVTDPTLITVLESAVEARRQCLQIIADLELASNQQADSGSVEMQKAANFQMRKQMNARLAKLRGLNRKAVLSVRSTKQETTEARQEIDTLHLQLQNLYYEQRHLLGEIAACEDYDHKYKQLPMVPVEEYLEAHPDSSQASDHDLTIARIEDERAARQTLEEQRLELAKRKDILVKETTAKKEELGRLDAEIEKWVGGQDAIRKIFEERDAKLAKDAAATEDGDAP